MNDIRANSILPARREAITLETADGVSLVGELALPSDHAPAATLICVHPLPTHGGMMDSHVYRKAAWRLPALADLAVLRFNTRGTSSVQGTSGGAFDNAVGERFDVAAAIEYAEFADLPDPWLVGWSFGSDLVLKYGRDPYVVGAILLSPPLRYTSEAELAAWAGDDKPLTALVPEFDDYLRTPEAALRFSVVPHAEVVGVPGAKHLWTGQAETVLDKIVARVRPSAAPLPSTWDGPMEFGDASAYADRTVAAFDSVDVPGPRQSSAAD
ncbi:MAG: alpha/beta hydrolase [Stackebrandtia sp.]